MTEEMNASSLWLKKMATDKWNLMKQEHESMEMCRQLKGLVF